ncbi:MAG: TonB-dependent receptor plug domain-containing protein [Candidatus Kapaibacterium sp.]
MSPPVFEIRKQTIRTAQYENLADLLRRHSPFIPMRNGGFGQYDAVSVLGAGPREFAVGVDGRPHTDLWSGQTHLTQVPVSMIERAEVLYGTDAVGLSSSSSLTTLNLQSVIYNTSAPFMSMWYHQGAGDLVAANVVYSQNIARGLNIAVNLRRAGARGRYQRTDYDQWNLDLQSRWTIDTRQSLLVRYGLATLNTQVWGGLDTAASTGVFEETRSVAFSGNKTLNDESRRNDLTATYQRTLNRDSTFILTAQWYLSRQSMHRILGVESSILLGDTSLVNTTNALTTGLVVRLERRLGDLRLRAGAHVQSRHIDSSLTVSGFDRTMPEAFLHADYRLRSALTMRAAARVHAIDSQTYVGFGWGMSMRQSGGVLKADVSLLNQEPSPQQRRFAVLPERHLLAVLEAKTDTGSVSAGITAYYRTVDNAIELVESSTPGRLTFINSSQCRVMGALGTLSAHWGSFEIVPRVRYQQSVSTLRDDAENMLMLDCTLSYVYTTIANSVRFGISAAWMPTSSLPSYEPLYWTFRQGAGVAPAQMDGISAFMTALVGNASVRASYENILGDRWVSVLNTPELTRVFRLSVDWSFND